MIPMKVTNTYNKKNIMNQTQTDQSTVASISIDLLDALENQIKTINDKCGSDENFIMNIMCVTLSRALFTYVNPECWDSVLKALTDSIKENLEMLQNVMPEEEKDGVV
jgi:hypothetical protein